MKLHTLDELCESKDEYISVLAKKIKQSNYNFPKTARFEIIIKQKVI